MRKLGILPMAGKANRFSGVFKELLPVGEDEYVVDSSINAFKHDGVDTIAIVTNPFKIGLHTQHFNKEKYSDLQFIYVLQKYDNDLLGAIMSVEVDANYYYLALPDVIIPEDSFLLNTESFITVNQFFTSTPERFGILGVTDGKLTIIDKPTHLTGGSYMAWSSFLMADDFFSRVHAEQVKNPTIKLQDAFTAVMHNFPDNVFIHNVKYHIDLANFKEYFKYLKVKNK